MPSDVLFSGCSQWFMSIYRSSEPEPEKKFGRVLHDFEAQGPDDLTIKVMRYTKFRQ